MTRSLVWVSGATGGLGLGIARTVPHADARIINVSRRQHPDYETVVADISEPAGWDAIRASFASEAARFRGDRMIFVHNAFNTESVGLIGMIDSAVYQRAVLANAAAPIILGEAFLKATQDLKCEVGLVLMSSGAATGLTDGLANYAAAKIGVEMWCANVRAEFAMRGDSRWVVAVRPGGVDTPGSRRNAALPKSLWPYVEIRAPMQKDFQPPEVVGARMWEMLPPPPDVAVINLGGPPAADPAAVFTKVAHRQSS
jgi:NAD(P)-dependent dehydrogenase (short-subunit alcohol dehydrogenase family)